MGPAVIYFSMKHPRQLNWVCHQHNLVYLLPFQPSGRLLFFRTNNEGGPGTLQALSLYPPDNVICLMPHSNCKACSPQRNLAKSGRLNRGCDAEDSTNPKTFILNWSVFFKPKWMPGFGGTLWWDDVLRKISNKKLFLVKLVQRSRKMK